MNKGFILFFFHALRKRRWNERVGGNEQLTGHLEWMHDAGEGILFRAFICVRAGQPRQ